MKINKWTLGLAAVGVVSLASVAQAEEKNALQTAISSTTISGYVDTSAQWNFGTGNANMPPYRFGGADKADGFNLNVVQLSISKPLDESEWAAGYRVDMWMGPDAQTLGTDSSIGLLDEGSDFAIRQAYVALRAPLGNGLDFKMGVFDTIIGYESLESGNNPNYTRSYGNTIEPTTHTGLLATYRFCDMVSASAGVANTTGPRINARASSTPYSIGLAGTPHNIDLMLGGDRAESYKSYMGSVALTAPQDWGWFAGSTLYGGVVNGLNTPGLAGGYVQTSWYAGATLATPVTGLKVGMSYDYMNADNSERAYTFGDLGDILNAAIGHPIAVAVEDQWAVAGYVSLQATEKLSLHARAEWYDAGYDTDIFALTTTIQYDLWQNVISRLEFRWDHGDGDVLFGDDSGSILSSPSEEDAFMLALNVIYKF